MEGRIVIVTGAPATGKSTVCALMAKHYTCTPMTCIAAFPKGLSPLICLRQISKIAP